MRVVTVDGEICVEVSEGSWVAEDTNTGKHTGVLNTTRFFRFAKKFPDEEAAKKFVREPPKTLQQWGQVVNTGLAKK